MSDDREDDGLRGHVGLPVVWQDGHGKTKMRGPDALVRAPNEKEIDAYGNVEQTTCGTCKFFDIENGQKEIARQRFAERLVQDEGWKLHHLGAPMELVGLCGMSNGELSTTAVSRACDQYREKGRRR